MHRKICMFIYISIRIHINYPLVIGLQFNSLQTGETVYVTSLFWNLLSHLTVNILRQIFHVFELNIYSVIILFSTWMITFDCLFLLFLRFLFIFRGREREREREGEKHQCVRETLISCLLHAANRKLNTQPRHVPSPGIEPMTFQFVGQSPNPLSHTSQGDCLFFLSRIFSFQF